MQCLEISKIKEIRLMIKGWNALLPLIINLSSVVKGLA